MKQTIMMIEEAEYLSSEKRDEVQIILEDLALLTQIL